ncbi:MAG TPA: serine/threonine-protein kinase, partial [Isosphaeraceae bacterium]
MNEGPVCPGCGSRPAADAPDGMCPLCLLGAALLDSEGPSSRPGRIPPGEDPAASGGDEPTAVPAGGADGGRPGPPARAARYHLQGEIGRGGMGVVLRGRDPELGRDLAVKVLLEPYQDRPELVRRFLEEARIGGQLQHPGVVPVYDVGRLPDRRPFIAMKLVVGRTLAELLGSRAGPAEDRPRFLAIFEQVCQAVAYAHTRGVLHRDLKPSNVMVGPFGEVQVMDWGLAKALGRGGSAGSGTEAPVWGAGDGAAALATDPGKIMGTAAYMAPEQARGEVERLDERADVFAVGAILCEILTGRPPYDDPSSARVLERAAAADLADALARLEGCGADVELIGLARGCLAADPTDRPPHAGAVAQAVA